MKYKLIVIGIDESYTRTGISIVADKEILKAFSINFKGCKSKSEKRIKLSLVLKKLIIKCQELAERVVIICERIRTFTGGKANLLRPKYLISTGALVATIVDTAYKLGIKTFSVDTRAWKSKVVGNIKGKGNSEIAKKMPTLEFVKSLGFDCFLGENKNGVKKYDDDKADSICIALYGFIPKKLRCLKHES